MTALVLDASASVEILLDTPTGKVLQDLVPSGAEWWIPEHYYVEVGGALRRAEIRGLAPSARVAVAFDRLMSAPLHRVQIRPLLVDAWRKRANVTLADAVYVTLAEHLGGVLVTGDIKLANSPGLPVPTIHP